MRHWAIFTDLDGTLLDSRTFDFSPALSILERLSNAHVPIVPVTSKTFAEVAVLAQELNLRHPMIVESGGAIARRTVAGWTIEALAPSLETLRHAIDEIERLAGVRVTRYSSMPPDEASLYSGLSGAALQRSQRRMFSEPIVVHPADRNAVIAAATSLGISAHRGGRFLHLSHGTSKREATARIRDELGPGLTMVALGDTPMDAPFLDLANVPIIVPRASGDPDPELRRAVPRARIAPAPGPEGWAASVAGIWSELERHGT